mmetsp:Transcript_27534/g.60399  ORF Transcript_27534/g.60399 Transcript_27534/m.60399 type:complete len:255 (-) Transcript_27534:31-795(-)
MEKSSCSGADRSAITPPLSYSEGGYSSAHPLFPGTNCLICAQTQPTTCMQKTMYTSIIEIRTIDGFTISSCCNLSTPCRSLSTRSTLASRTSLSARMSCVAAAADDEPSPASPLASTSNARESSCAIGTVATTSMKNQAERMYRLPSCRTLHTSSFCSSYTSVIKLSTMSTPKHESTTMAITSQPNEFNSKAMRYGTTMMETMISKHMYRSHATFHRAPIGTMYQGRGISSTTAATDGRRRASDVLFLCFICCV